MKGLSTVLFCIGVIFLSLSFLQADPIIGCGANTLKQMSFMFEGHFGYTSYNARYHIPGEEWIAFGNDESNTVMLILPQLHYGILDFLNIRLSVPFVMNRVDYGTSISSSYFSL